jgi:hypothetical protein
MRATKQEIKDAAARLGMTVDAIYYRLNSGWDKYDALTLPRQPNGIKSRATRRVTDRISRTVTTTTRIAQPAPQAQSFAFAPNTRVVVDFSKGMLILEPVAA